MRHAIILALLAAGALAQDDATLLAGPDVDGDAKATTLVVRGYDGMVKDLDVPVDEAAIDLLDLDEMTIAEIDRIVTERAAILDKVVIDNIGLLVELQSARGNQERRREIHRELFDAAAPLLRRGPLRDEIAGVLDDARRTTYLEIIDEYERAMLTQARAEAEDGRFNPRQYHRRQAIAQLGRELKRSYDRQVGSRQEDLESLLVELALDLETEAEIRRMILEYGQRALLNPDEADRSELIRQILAEIPPDKRQDAIRILRSRAGMGNG